MFNASEYHKKWAAAHKQQLYEYHKNYRHTHAAEYVAYTQKYRAAHYEEIRAQEKKNSKKYRDRDRLEALIHYSGNSPKCACCGETNIKFLTFDHINGGGTKHMKQVGFGGAFVNWLRKNNYPEGFQVLCYNCNCGRAHNNGICPHEIREV